MTAEKIHFCIEQVHRPALATRAARGLSVKLRHHCVRSDAFGNRLPMFAIAGEDVIIGTKRGNCTHPDRFLTDIEMAEAADLSQAVAFSALLFKPANQEHLTKHRQQCLAILFEGVGLYFWRGRIENACGPRCLLSLFLCLTAHAERTMPLLI